MKFPATEIIAIGDELVSGQRLDTNSQWLSQRLGELGVEPCFHTTVGDDYAGMLQAFQTALSRCELLVSTGGIGPTQDDLTRQVIADLAQVDLVYYAELEDHIRSIFAGYGRPMPENNKVQAYLPAGATAIHNDEGTAPGIDINIRGQRLFALPGVPYEAHRMWHDHVAPAIASLLQGRQRIVHHVLNCFGAGESQIESMLQGMTHRTHQPRVGITASQATISLRISAAGTDESNCQQQIKPVAERIRTLLGDLIYGENDVTLEQVVVAKLRAANFTCGIVDFGFGGAVGLALFTADPQRQWIKHSESKFQEVSGASLAGEAENLKMKHGLDIAVAVGNVYQIPEQTELNFDLAISNPARTYQQTLRHGGHSGLRDSRTAKQILNQIRLFLSH